MSSKEIKILKQMIKFARTYQTYQMRQNEKRKFFKFNKSRSLLRKLFYNISKLY